MRSDFRHVFTVLDRLLFALLFVFLCATFVDGYVCASWRTVVREGDLRACPCLIDFDGDNGAHENTLYQFALSVRILDCAHRRLKARQN